MQRVNSPSRIVNFALGLLAANAWLWPSALSAAETQAARKPNIVVIVADDLGYGEITCSGKQEIPTPRIRSIATGGVCFTNGYVTCPVCSPTRAGLITGRYQQRFGHEFNPGPAAQAEATFGLPLTEATLATRLKKLGYATGMVGKWHLGFKSEYRPLQRGFDEFYGFLGGAHSYTDSAADANNPVYRGDEAIDEKAYLTDAFGREAAAFIDRHKQEPFFLYLTFNAVHAPLQAPDKYTGRFSQIGDERRRTWAAMLSAMDDNVGAILDKLAQEKLDERTLIVFISDNGGPTLNTTSRNDPLHGYKGQVWEGGIRVPYMVQWKGKLPAGKVYDQPVIALDIVPTAIAAAGGSVSSDHPVDGVDLTPYLTGQKTGRPHDALYWRFGPQWAIRRGDFKLLQTLEGGAKLFDLASDVGEQRDLAADKPDLVKELQANWRSWDSQLEAPKWKGRQAVRAAARQKAAGQGKAKGKGKGKAKAAPAQP
jgi:arylsulfatase A-like enzyme